MDKAPPKPYQAAPSIYALGANWVNWYVIVEDGGMIAVDAGLAGFASRLDADLAALGLANQRLAALLLTHADPDHTGLVGELRRRGAEVYVHPDDQPLLAQRRAKGGEASPRQMARLAANPGFWRLAYRFARGGRSRPFHEGKPLTLGVELDLPGRPTAIPTPGHTAGHCVIHCPSLGALFVGDLLCTYNPLGGPSGPQPLPRQLNEDNARCRRSLEAIAELDAQVVLPGHGPPFFGSPAQAVERALAASHKVRQ